MAGSKEDDEVCLNILKQSNYYSVLGVSQDAPLDQVKKSYKIKALKVHPDKNKSAHSQAAFQKLSRAFICLSNEALRKIYDETGDEEITEKAIMTNFDEDFAEKVFSKVIIESQYEYDTPPIYKSYLAKCLLLQLVPVLLILFISSYITNLENSLEFSFKISPHYNLKKMTKDSNITFYINSNYFRELDSDEVEILHKKVEKIHKELAEGKPINSFSEVPDSPVQANEEDL